MTYLIRDVHGRPVELGTGHGNVIIRVGGRTAELDKAAARNLRERIFDAETDALHHSCGDCAKDET